MSVYAYDSDNENLIPVAASSTDFIGATASTAGTHGLVPAPLAADLQKFLSAKGSWEYAGNIFYGTRTEWNQLTAAQKAIFSSANMGIVCLYNDGIFEYDVTNDTLIVLSSRGHVIKNESGTAFTERTNLQIKNGFVSDDNTSDATIIESDNFVGTQAEWNALSAAEQAKYKSRDITDDSYETENKSQLTTQDKSSLVGAINEVNSKTIVNQNDVYGYINSNNVFVPFKSQADIDAAVSAAMVGNATAADVLAGKTFTNSSGSGLVGTFNPYSIFTDSNKWTVIYQTQDSTFDGRSYVINNIVAGEKYVTFFIPYEIIDDRTYFKNGPVSQISIQNPNVLSVIGNTYVNFIGMIVFEGLSSGSTSIQLTYPIPTVYGGIECFFNVTAKLNI